MSRTILNACVVAVWASLAFGQTTPLAFDAVSVKPNKSGSGSSHSSDHEGVLTATNVSLKSFIMRAYGVREYQVEGPDWLADEHFDVAAKPPSKVTDEQFAQMLQTMLAERFKLTVHRGNKVLPAYALVVAKGGVKMTAVEDDGNHGTNSTRNKLTATRCSPDRLAQFLTRQMDRPVVDGTGLKAVYNFTLNWTPEDAVPAKAEQAKGDEQYPPLLTALQEQLGLKLEPKKVPIEVLVIDHVERVPTEN